MEEHPRLREEEEAEVGQTRKQADDRTLWSNTVHIVVRRLSQQYVYKDRRRLVVRREYSGMPEPRVEETKKTYTQHTYYLL